MGITVDDAWVRYRINAITTGNPITITRANNFKYVDEVNSFV